MQAFPLVPKYDRNVHTVAEQIYWIESFYNINKAAQTTGERVLSSRGGEKLPQHLHDSPVVRPNGPK